MSTSSVAGRDWWGALRCPAVMEPLFSLLGGFLPCKAEAAADLGLPLLSSCY